MSCCAARVVLKDLNTFSSMMVMTPNNLVRCFLLVALPWGLACLTGCSSLALPKPSGWNSRSDKVEIPTRVVAVWTDTIMNQPGQRGVRGVGGRLLFYAAHDESPVQVNGTLTIYAYDDSEKIESEVAPARKFVFLPEQLVNHQSTSTIGSSYNVWLPWNEVGNPARQLTLIVRFEPDNGAVVMSDPARQMLPGVASSTRVKNSTLERAADQQPPQRSQLELASHEAAPLAAPPDEARPVAADPLGTFTIDLPADVARRWHAQVGSTLDRSPARAAPHRATAAISAAAAQGRAGKDAAIAPPRRVESAITDPTRSRRVTAREIPSRVGRRPSRTRSASATPTETH